jgi:hypothetical protein
MKRFKQFVLVVVLAASTVGGAALYLSPAAQAGPDKVFHKSYVCKYVSKPGEQERLQTGQNPIWVDNHSLGDHSADVTFVGEEFTDAQGRSVVIVANTDKLNPEPGISACEGETPSPTPTPTPTPTVPPTKGPKPPVKTHKSQFTPRKNLAHTGADVTKPAGLALMLTGLGLGALALARKKVTI